MSVVIMLMFGVYHLLLSGHDCIKFKIEFLATKNFLINFYTLRSLPACVLSTAQTKSSVRFRD